MPRQPIDLESPLPAQREAGIRDGLLVIWDQRRLVALLTALGLVCGSLVALLLERVYTAETLVQIDFGREPSAGPSQVGGGVQVDPNALVEGEARLVRSQTVARRVIDQLGLDSDPAFAGRSGILGRLLPAWSSGSPADPSSRADQTALTVLRQLSVKNDSRSYLITISYGSPDPVRSAAIANAFAEEYLKTRVEAAVEAAQHTSDWFGAQLRDARKALAEAEEGVVAYRNASGFVEASPEGSGVSQNQLRDVTAQLETATLARIVAEGRLRKAQDAVRAGYAPEPAEGSDSGLLQRLTEAEASAARAVAETRLAYGVRHPNYERAAAAQRAAREQLDVEIKRILAAHEASVVSARSTEASLQQRAETLKRAAIESKSREARLRALQGEAAALRERTRILAESYERSKALSELKPAVAKIILPAKISRVPSGPNRLLIIALATVGAVGAGIVAALLLNRRDRGFGDENDVALQTGQRCLATVPEVRPADSTLKWALFSEAVKHLAVNLGLGSASAQVVLVTSSMPREGKTILTVALAKHLAESGRQVLVIDASPGAARGQTEEVATLETLLDRPEGLSEADDAGERMRLVRRAGGVGDDAPIFGRALDRLIASARERYDIVLIEAAPIEFLADAVVLGRNVDLVVLAARWMSTPRARVAASLERLAASSARFAGIVLSRVDQDVTLGRRHMRTRASYFARHLQPAPKLAVEDGTCAS